MPVWLIAAVVAAAIAVGAVGEHVRASTDASMQAYGQHSIVHAKASVAETIRQSRRSPRPPRGWTPPPTADVKDTAETVYFPHCLPPHGEVVAARRAAGAAR